MQGTTRKGFISTDVEGVQPYSISESGIHIQSGIVGPELRDGNEGLGHRRAGNRGRATTDDDRAFVSVPARHVSDVQRPCIPAQVHLSLRSHRRLYSQTRRLQVLSVHPFARPRPETRGVDPPQGRMVGGTPHGAQQRGRLGNSIVRITTIILCRR